MEKLADADADRDDRSLSEVLREAIASKNVTLAWLRSRLADDGNPVSLATLSYWRSGQRHPEGAASHVALESLERILDLPTGELTGLIGPVTEPVYPDRTLDQQWADASRHLAAVGINRTGVIQLRSLHSTVDVDHHGDQRRLHHRMLVQSRIEGLTEFGIVIGGTGGARGQVEVVECHGARIERTLLSDDALRFVMAVTLEEPLALGERSVVEFTLALPPGFCDEPRHVVSCRTQFKEVVVWTRFDPDHVPSSCEEITVDGDHEVVTRRKLVGFSTHLQRRDFGPGAVGVRWAW